MSDNSPQECTELLFSFDSPTLERLDVPLFPGISLASDYAHSQSECQSQSQSQTPGGSAAGRRQQNPTDNPRRPTKPMSLSYYRSTEVHAPLSEAKESFAATAFASGCFFYHRRSHYTETFKTFARDAIAQAANAHNSKSFNLYYYHFIIVLITIFSSSTLGQRHHDSGTTVLHPFGDFF